ncbi:PD-(D/E)XK nuclease family protein [Candidatus Kaiserbacteria bacterium]|nr:PD-(D/E)XK nuclease family protein [Candidatus Kaiserbacteria bacterium]
MAYSPPGATMGSVTPDLGPQSGRIKTWSYSSLTQFETCPHQTFLAKVEKLPQASSPALDRGNQIHKLAEDYVKGEGGDQLPDELKKFASEIEELKQLYAEGTVEVEGDWAFTTDWETTGYYADDTWNRMKLDVLVRDSLTSAKVVDYKTGKKFGNEFKHAQQGQLYAVGTFLRYPELQYLEVEFWYLDHGEKLQKTYTREQAMMFLPMWTQRATKLTTCTDFIAKPSKSNCRWCSFKNNGCEWGIE